GTPPRTDGTLVSRRTSIARPARVAASVNAKAQTVLKRMMMSSTAHTARMIAKLLANRATTREEIPDLIDQVHRTLLNIGRPRGQPESVKDEVAIKIAPA